MLAALGLVAACGQMTPSGLVQASRLDPVGTSPQDIAVAVTVPENIKLRSGDATLYLGFRPEDGSGSAVGVSVPLTKLDEKPDSVVTRPNEAVHVFGFTPENAMLLADVQAQIKALKDANIPGEGTLSISISAACYVGELDQIPLASTWLKTGAGAQFTQFTRATNLYDLFDAASAGDGAAGLRQC